MGRAPTSLTALLVASASAIAPKVVPVETSAASCASAVGIERRTTPSSEHVLFQRKLRHSAVSATDAEGGQPTPGGVTTWRSGGIANSSFRIFMWNPHWQCFDAGHWISKSCKGGANNALEQTLHQSVDFANVVEIADDEYQAPVGFQMLTQKCHWDKTTLFWDSTRWEMVGPARGGCMQTWPRRDRPFVVQSFRRRGGDQTPVAVVGAHFPHGRLDTMTGIDTLAAAISASGAQRVIFIADTNLDRWTTSASIFRRLGIATSAGHISTDLLLTCCKDDGFSHTYDRVITNFGTSMRTTLLHDPLPPFAQNGVWQFHKGIMGEFDVRE